MYMRVMFLFFLFAFDVICLLVKYATFDIFVNMPDMALIG